MKIRKVFLLSLPLLLPFHSVVTGLNLIYHSELICLSLSFCIHTKLMAILKADFIHLHMPIRSMSVSVYECMWIYECNKRILSPVPLGYDYYIISTSEHCYLTVIHFFSLIKFIRQILYTPRKASINIPLAKWNTHSRARMHPNKRAHIFLVMCGTNGSWWRQNHFPSLKSS